jgi:hypothetical protein
VLRFQVFLDEKPIGEHSFQIAETGGNTRVTSRASFDIDVLFFRAYRYRHDSREVFRNGCLQEIRATTNDNGRQYHVEGRAVGEQFRVKHQDGSEQALGCLMTFAYWDRSFLEQDRLLNAQTGEVESVRVHRKGGDRARVADRLLPATRYALSTDRVTIDLWYNDELGWVGLSSDTGKGRRLIYERL